MIATAVPATALDQPPAPKRLIRYRNDFRWRILPPDEAVQAGFLDKGFETKKQAVKYQRRIKEKFPGLPCCLIDTGRFYDSMGRPCH